MVGMDSALMLGVIQLLFPVVSAGSMAAMEYVLSTPALLMLLHEAVVSNMAVATANAGLQNAPLKQSASSNSAGSMVGLASAHTHQDAASLHLRQVATARGTQTIK